MDDGTDNGKNQLNGKRAFHGGGWGGTFLKKSSRLQNLYGGMNGRGVGRGGGGEMARADTRRRRLSVVSIQKKNHSLTLPLV